MFCAGQFDLCERQCKLAERSDRCNRRYIKQQSSVFVEHLLKETSEESGETSRTGIARKRAVSYTPIGKRPFKVFTEKREGNREKRDPFMFDSGRDGFSVTGGADSAPLPHIMEQFVRELDQAFHPGLL